MYIWVVKCIDFPGHIVSTLKTFANGRNGHSLTMVSALMEKL